MSIRLEVSLSPKGLRIHLPAGRTLDINAGESGAKFLREMLQNAEEYERTQEARKGYIGAFPTQEITNSWNDRAKIEEQVREVKKQKAIDEAEAKRKKWEDMGVDASSININL